MAPISTSPRYGVHLYISPLWRPSLHLPAMASVSTSPRYGVHLYISPLWRPSLHLPAMAPVSTSPRYVAPISTSPRYVAPISPSPGYGAHLPMLRVSAHITRSIIYARQGSSLRCLAQCKEKLTCSQLASNGQSLANTLDTRNQTPLLQL